MIKLNIRGQNINVGNEVVKKLNSNKNLGWKFVDEKNALKGVKRRKYYASIEILSDFSKNLSSITSNDIKK